MMKITYLLLPALTMTLLACSSQQEEEYIETPEASQISDLQDDDNDGVVNARDTCPGTPESSLVDNEGCGETVSSQEVRQLNILFANDSFEVNPIFSDQITTMAEFLETYQSASIEIQGYASKVGASEYNLELSKKRAHHVEDELLSNGIDPSRVRVVGYGEERLESEGDDATSHALNRRVTATVVGLSEQIVEEWTIFTTLKK
ncbi:OmpA family protein [Vibrio sp. Isolate33]|uniref:OmpA family protein n=1 Tax=Vibrio TaxID=662 RepID=UPI000474863B|nr:MULTISPECIES: OmpA family protein [Vibrio]MCG9545582.1 OmpA family protein [Vibrio sp. Isolate33]MDD1829451.1 OmpA family protein [Photobacterium sp. ZSDE20]NVN83702.1 OmpA family protein [Vibrio sp. Scap16]QLE94484.1 OmpA family protein [Vibrio sp. Scap24]UPR58383.1 OmpA family protein [Vibrio sp. ED004]